MPIYLTLKRGPKLYVEYARWTRPGAWPGTWIEVRRERGELLLWLGRWHAIYTPARWSPGKAGTSRGVLNGGSRPT
ncbi:hypothetical protein JL100_028990 [Skermanella mucosa]|uniref:hypothetical protein n=1 Tax=Skermanella mucosa TaxID=1789672 RepID=UPI00192BF3AB|nr:hypothetical protein [Skermanella mucosa]UEM21050.1 hypothetical protein JL100_028990 [Skermanella mucosa]